MQACEFFFCLRKVFPAFIESNHNVPNKRVRISPNDLFRNRRIWAELWHSWLLSKFGIWSGMVPFRPQMERLKGFKWIEYILPRVTYNIYIYNLNRMMIHLYQFEHTPIMIIRYLKVKTVYILLYIKKMIYIAKINDSNRIFSIKSHCSVL